MKVVCAWCGILVRGDAEDEEKTHGVCPPCRDVMMGEIKQDEPELVEA